MRRSASGSNRPDGSRDRLALQNPYRLMAEDPSPTDFSRWRHLVIII